MPLATGMTGLGWSRLLVEDEEIKNPPLTEVAYGGYLYSIKTALAALLDSTGLREPYRVKTDSSATPPKNKAFRADGKANG